MLQEEGRSIYLESQGWQTWINITRAHGGAAKLNDNSPLGSTLRPGKHLPHAFQGSPWRQDVQSSLSSRKCPVSVDGATKLWTVFMQRVEPIMKISFEWTLERLQSALVDSNLWENLSLGEHALALSSCFFGVVTLSDNECARDFSESKSSLLSQYRQHCEDSFARIIMLAIDDILTLKALCVYTKASIDVVTNQSLWSLMGLISRSAELLGIHRDGELMGLSPIETEDRRRLWWQVQHLDLILAIKNGVTPLTFTADWDAKLPLNIDDCDITLSSKTTPKERTGLTGISYTLFTYWMIDQQRNFRQKRLNQRSPVDRSLLGPLTTMMVDDLEAGLQTNFLQYCDPIKPLDLLLQISARAVVCVLRLRGMHEMRLVSDQLDNKFHDKYFSMCMQALGYTITTYSQPMLRPFHWLAETSFGWHAFIALLLDMPQLRDSNKIKAAWTLLDDLYAMVAFLTDFSEDKRRLSAADLLIVTWNVCERKPELGSMRKPAFVAKLEDDISRFRDKLNMAEEVIGVSGSIKPTESEFTENQPGTGDLLNFNFADIDWSYWDTVNLGLPNYSAEHA
ncbi:hypothetical protein QQS21_001255 [Conoideocrella luteorostrata]|uniref:Xylanolytic transcriptional activator regulatory domain-containing protein n=1 Tax=Conoideocrella luteorostrata TaxID=1105319 RepID=A0AAJ0D0D4_9HYPO|nr:hypothetical protein QQS21_001255 [Conoideocrella luteorostrata]